MVPMYYRVFEKTGMQLKEYVSVLFPATSASTIMAVLVLLMRMALPAGSHPLPYLVLLTIIGALSYAGALLALHRPRVNHMIRIIGSLRRH